MAFSRILALASLMSTMAASVSPPASAQPVPEFFGVYAVSQGKLIELKLLNHSRSRSMDLIGADTLTGLSDISVNDPNVYFIIYREGAASSMTIFLEQMKEVRYLAPSEFERSGALKPVEGSWVGLKVGYNLKVAPLKENPQMMVRAVSPQPIPPGRYGLNIGDSLFDLQIGPPTESCVVRQPRESQGRVNYLDCEEFFAANPSARPGSASSEPSEPAETDAPQTAVRRSSKTVIDEDAQLMWMARDNGLRAEWDQADTYCNNLDLEGFTDWRLPSVEEWRGIYREAPGGSSSTNFGSTRIGLSLSSCCVWTSTPDDEGRKQFFSFASGTPGRILVKFIDLKLMRAICVRSTGSEEPQS